MAFEPMPENCEDLRFNVRLNHLSFIVVHETAAAAVDGQCEFLFDDQRPTMGKLAGVEQSNRLTNSRRVTVRTERLDSWKAQRWPAPQFLKIDVEGGAAEVLPAANELIGELRPAIYVELHGPEERAAIAQLMRTFDYRGFTVDGAAVSDPTANGANPLVCRPSDRA